MTSSLSEESRAFLQKRTSRYGLLLGSLGLVFLVIRLLSEHPADGSDLIESTSLQLHSAGAFTMILLFALNAKGSRSESFIRHGEMLLLTASCLSYGAMTSRVPAVFRPDATLTLIFGTALVTRAIYVPSSWRWTAGMALVMGIELSWITHQISQNFPRDLLSAYAAASSSDAPPSAALLILNTLVWWFGFAAIATSASHIIYGLRRAAETGRRLGQYTLVRKIGEGGVGRVYEAKHAMLRRPTAVKLLKPEMIDEASLARFEREVRAAATLQHPNTVTVFDYGRTPDGVFYYAMELVRGATLTRAVDVGGPMHVARAIDVMHQIASGLVGAHEAGLIHRDIKPDNVLLTPVAGCGEVAKVLDFGLVLQETKDDPSITREGSIVGTPQYLAPETIRGETVDARSDLYALGAIGFFLLTGQHVFGAKTIVEVCSMHLTQMPAAPSKHRGADVPVELDELILKLLEKDPARRFASAAEVQKELAAVAGFGSWSADDSRRWWADIGPELLDAEGDAGSLDTKAIAVDLGRRT